MNAESKISGVAGRLASLAIAVAFTGVLRETQAEIPPYTPPAVVPKTGIGLWESPPKEEIATQLESELGLKSILLSPCKTADGGKDYIEIMRENIARLRDALGKEGTAQK